MSNTFKPRPDQVDYSKARWAPVINCVLRYRSKILVVERSKNLNFYPGYWNGVSGFLDDKKTMKEKIDEEIKEELGLDPGMVGTYKMGQIFHQDEPKYNKTWIVHPVLVNVKTDQVQLDWEAKNFKWLPLKDVKKLNLLPGFDQVLKRLSKWI